MIGTSTTIIFLIAGLANAATRDVKMTYEQAKARLPQRELPAFWVSDVKDLASSIEKLKLGQVQVIAKSPGGRPIHLVAFGEREAVRHRANFNSAVGGQDLSAYADKSARKKPVILFVGPVHGHEVEGLTGLMNLIQVMEMGRDLRGKEQSELRSLGQRCRLLIIPEANPDAITRFEPRAIHGMPLDEFQFWGMGTWADDRIAFWPDSKRQHPRTGPEIGFLGCYFNDAGVNPMHEEFFAPMSTEAPAILRIAMEEAPDLAVSLHSHGAAPVLLRPAYVPAEIQQEVRSLATKAQELFTQRTLPFGGLPAIGAEEGTLPDSFNLVSALYHISGATPFVFECPHGVKDAGMCQVDLDQILDIQLSLYEVMLRTALEQKQQAPAPGAKTSDARPRLVRDISGTFSIVAVDPESGMCGAAVASKYPAVGKVVPYARAGVGAFCTQHWHEPKWGERALDLLEKRTLPEAVLGELLRDDPQRDKRQLAIIDMSGRAANRNPADADPSGVYWGAMSGRFYACQGNTLTGREVITAMAKAYEETKGSLADRLMAALSAGDRAGGDHRGRLAAGLLVAKQGVPGYWLELQVDKSDDAVRELAEKYREWADKSSDETQ